MVVGVLAVISQVEAFFLCFVACAYADCFLQDKQNHKGNETRPHQRNADVL